MKKFNINHKLKMYKIKKNLIQKNCIECNKHFQSTIILCKHYNINI